jgi:hypothetical protein
MRCTGLLLSQALPHTSVKGLTRDFFGKEPRYSFYPAVSAFRTLTLPDTFAGLEKDLACI